MVRAAEWFGAAAVAMLVCAIPLHVFGDGSKWEGACWVVFIIFVLIAGACCVIAIVQAVGQHRSEQHLAEPQAYGGQGGARGQGGSGGGGSAGLKIEFDQPNDGRPKYGIYAEPGSRVDTYGAVHIDTHGGPVSNAGSWNQGLGAKVDAGSFENKETGEVNLGVELERGKHLAELFIAGRQILAFEPDLATRLAQPEVTPYADQALRVQYNDWHRTVYELLRKKWGPMEAAKFLALSVAVRGEEPGFYRRLQAQLEYLATLAA